MQTTAAYILTLLLAAAGEKPPTAAAEKYCQITVDDDRTGRGVPMVELQTVHNVRYYTDSGGIVAFHEPGLMGRKVFFHVRSHGYEFPKDGFGYRGRAVEVTEGGRVTLKIKRINIAQRLYRITGAGIYRDSVLLGRRAAVPGALLNARVFGSDSVLNAIYRGRIYWFWGDTNRPGYPLGNFHVPGATSRLPADGGLDPDLGVDLDYFTRADGFAKETAHMPGQGPTWLGPLVVLGERMFAGYVKVRKGLEVYQRGLVEFNDAEKRFKKIAEFDMAAPVRLGGHPFRRKVNGRDYIYFADPYPLVRVPATADCLKDPATFEAFTCLQPGSRPKDARLGRYAWKKNTSPVGPAEQAKLIQRGKLKPRDALLHLRDVETGKAVRAHRGSVYFNAFRRRWILIATEVYGTSMLGELWYAEAARPLGPWVYARKIVTHEKYSFYNPKQHPMFDARGGRTIYFEGTYTHTFSGSTDPTPRYDYNQILYKLDLTDPRLALPVPVYRTPGGLATAAGGPIAFFALDRPTPAAVAVCQSDTGALRLTRKTAKPLFYALAPDTASPPPNTIPLDKRISRTEKPICLVWQNPGPATWPQ